MQHCFALVSVLPVLVMSGWERWKRCFTQCFNHTSSPHTKYVLKKIKACFQDMMDSALSPPHPPPTHTHAHISPLTLHSNDLCLIRGYKRCTSSDRLHIRSRIFIINPSPRMKVMAVPSPLRDPRRHSPCVRAALPFLAPPPPFSNIPQVGVKREPANGAEGRGRPRRLVRLLHARGLAGRGAQTCDAHLGRNHLECRPVAGDTCVPFHTGRFSGCKPSPTRCPPLLNSACARLGRPSASPLGSSRGVLGVD